MRPESVFITKEKQEDTLSIKGDIKYSMFLGEKVRYFINDKLGKEWIVDHFNSGMDILEGEVFINADKSMAHLIVDK
ncbi:hypothetical protein AAGC89_17445 [Proteus mirabilis]